jgi:hypothetical protein
MNRNGMLPEEQNPSSGETPDATTGWRKLVTASTFAILITIAALVAGLLLAGKLGLGGSLLPGIGLVVLVALGQSFMHGGPEGRRGRVAHGSHRTPLAGSEDTSDLPGSRRGHSGCH